MKFLSLILLTIWVSGTVIGSAVEPPIANTATEIENALAISGDPIWVDGIEYRLEKGKLYKIVNGKKKRVRKPSKAEKQSIEPRVIVPIEFKPNTDELTPDSEVILSEIAKALNSASFKLCRFRLECHTDSVGSAEDNLMLAEARAQSVRHLFIHRYNVGYRRFTVEWYGESRPIADNATEEGRRLNQRFEIVREIP